MLFSDCNATRSDAKVSDNPDIVRFEITKAEKVFSVPELLRHYYQAEVLVPSPLPPHLIIFPRKPRSQQRKKDSNHVEERHGCIGTAEMMARVDLGVMTLAMAPATMDGSGNQQLVNYNQCPSFNRYERKEMEFDIGTNSKSQSESKTVHGKTVDIRARPPGVYTAEGAHLASLDPASHRGGSCPQVSSLSCYES